MKPISKNKEKSSLESKKYMKDNPEQRVKKRESSKNWRQENPTYYRKYRNDNLEKAHLT